MSSSSLFAFNPIDYKALTRELKSSKEFNDQVKHLRTSLLLSETELNQRQQLSNKLENYLNESKIPGKFYLFGSSANSLGFKEADVDLYFELDSVRDNEDGTDDCVLPKPIVLEVLGFIRRVLKLKLNISIEEPIVARVPIIKLDFKFKNGLNCDISLTSAHGVAHGRLLTHMCHIEPMFRDLALITKVWMKNSYMIDCHQITSFASSLMVMFYLQQKQLLPPVSSLSIDETNYAINTEVQWISPLAEKPTIAQLFLDFFTFFGSYDFKKVISPFHGTPQPRSLLVLKSVKAKTLTVQDPFDLSLNVTHNTRKSFSKELVATFKFLAATSEWLHEKLDGDHDTAAKSLFEYLISNNVTVSKEKRTKLCEETALFY